MNRPLLSVISAVLLCAHSVSALAADSASAATSQQHIRAQVEAKRDQLSGAAKISPPAQKGPAAVLDAPVETDDAPAQAQRP